MGWTFTEKPDDVRAYLLDQVTEETAEKRLRPLDIAIVHITTAYLAVETTIKETGESYVWAAVVLMQYYPKERYGFGTKWLDETVGPTLAECPERILKRLTKTPHENDSSREWRRRCWAEVEAKRSVSERSLSWRPGDALTFSDRLGNGLRFDNGVEIHDFVLVDKQRRLFSSPGLPGVYHIPRRFWSYLSPAATDAHRILRRA